MWSTGDFSHKSRWPGIIPGVLLLCCCTASLPSVFATDIAFMPTTGTSKVSSPDLDHLRGILPRGTCKVIEIIKDDGCWAVAQRCGISTSDLQKYNPDPKFCDSLKSGDHACCSSGDLPDFSPQPNKDGTCLAYTFKNDGDLCYQLADKYKTTTDKIEKVNKKTWGWAGCSHLIPNQTFCLSEGDPPMPAIISTAVCGPQMPGTVRPRNGGGAGLADLNPCPLNACCDIWGQCGTTEEFCTPSPADTGAPGTARPGTNGCISNCDTKIVNNKEPPSTFRSIGYFEAWNVKQRGCATMHVDQIKSSFNIIHFAFIDITSDFHLNASAVQDQFDALKKIDSSKQKRVISIGGWAQSTEPATFALFRTGVQEAHRAEFAKNVVQFVVDHGLDGIDCDWEYPAEPDIPGIPADNIESAKNYLLFLQAVKGLLPSGKTLSIAAPASYWYLKAFPIKAIARTVDYIVYMTYDLHGQWDAGNKWAM